MLNHNNEHLVMYSAGKFYVNSGPNNANISLSCKMEYYDLDGDIILQSSNVALATSTSYMHKKHQQAYPKQGKCSFL